MTTEKNRRNALSPWLISSSSSFWSGEVLISMLTFRSYSIMANRIEMTVGIYMKSQRSLTTPLLGIAQSRPDYNKQNAAAYKGHRALFKAARS